MARSLLFSLQRAGRAEESSMSTLIRDLRFAVRLLFKHPALTWVALTTMALGIAANAVIFSVVNAVVLRPLPYAHADELVQVHTATPKAGLDRFWVSPFE